MEELFRVSPNARPIFTAAGADVAALYTAQAYLGALCPHHPQPDGSSRRACHRHGRMRQTVCWAASSPCEARNEVETHAASEQAWLMTALPVGVGSAHTVRSPPQEAGVVAVTYAKARGLEAGASSPAQLLLDPDLSDALFKALASPSTAALQLRH